MQKPWFQDVYGWLFIYLCWWTHSLEVFIARYITLSTTKGDLMKSCWPSRPIATKYLVLSGSIHNPIQSRGSTFQKPDNKMDTRHLLPKKHNGIMNTGGLTASLVIHMLLACGVAGKNPMINTEAFILWLTGVSFLSNLSFAIYF